MNRYYLPLLLLLAATTVYGQKKPKESFYVLDENWKGTTIEHARYLIRELQFNDSSYRWDTYNFTGPLIKSAETKDGKGELLHGRFTYYNEKGLADSTGKYVNGVKNGSWYQLNEKGKIVYEYKYDMGKLIGERNILEEDALEKQLKTDKTASIVVESEFPGGVRAWQRYLNRNLRYPQRALNIKKQGMVSVFFTVTEEGEIQEPFLFRSAELSLDDESMRMILISPQWTPALKNEKKVKSYKTQPIIYRLG